MSGYEGHTPDVLTGYEPGSLTEVALIRANAADAVGQQHLAAHLRDLVARIESLLTRVEALERGLRKIAARECLAPKPVGPAGRELIEWATCPDLAYLADWCATCTARHLLNNGNGEGT